MQPYQAGLASPSPSPEGSPISVVTTTTDAVFVTDPSTPMKDRETSEPRVSFEEGIQMERSPSKSSLGGSPSKSRTPEAHFGKAITDLERKYIITSLGSADSLKHGTESNIRQTSEQMWQLLNLDSESKSALWRHIFAIYAGLLDQIVLQKTGYSSTVIRNRKELHPTDTAYFLFETATKPDISWIVSDKDNQLILSKTDFLDYFAKGLYSDPALLVDALAVKLALAKVFNPKLDLENAQMTFIPHITDTDFNGTDLIVYNTKSKSFSLVSDTEVKSPTKEDNKKLQTIWKTSENFFSVRAGQVYLNKDGDKDNLVLYPNPFDVAVSVSEKPITSLTGYQGFFSVAPISGITPTPNIVLIEDSKYTVIPRGFNLEGVKRTHSYLQPGSNQNAGFHDEKRYLENLQQLADLMAQARIKAPSRSSSAASLGSSAASDKA